MKRALIVLAALLLALGAALTAVLQTAAGRDLVLDAAQRLGGGRLQIGAASGVLAGPLRLDTLRYDDPELGLAIRGLELDWTPTALLLPGAVYLNLRIDELELNRRTLDASPAEPGPPALPDRLLPLTLVIERLSIGELRLAVDDQPRLTVHQLALAGSAGPDRLDLDSLSARIEAVGELRASAALQSDAAVIRLDHLRLRGAIHADAEGRLDRHSHELQARLTWKGLRWPMQGEPLIDSEAGELSAGGSLAATRFRGRARLGEETEVRLDGDYSEERLTASLDWERLRWPLRGEALADSPSGRLRLAGPLGALETDLEARLGEHTQLTASGHLDADRWQLEADWESLQWPLRGEPVLRSSSGRVIAGGAWDVAEFEGSAQLGDAQENAEAGSLSYRGRAAADALELDLQWERLRWPQAGEALLAGADGSLRLDGRPDAWRLQAGTALNLRDAPLRAELRADGDRDRATVHALRLDGLDGQAELVGSLDWTRAVASASARLDGLNPGAVLPSWPGSLSGEAELGADWSREPNWQLAWSLPDSRLRERPISSRGSASGNGERLRLTAAELLSGNSRLRIDGALWPELAAELVLESPDLRDLLPGVDGSASLNARIDGSWRLPALSAQGSLSDLRWAHYGIESADLRAEAGADGELTVQLSARALDLGYRFDSARVIGSGRVVDHRFRFEAEGPDGEAGATLSGKYDPEALRWRGRLADGRLDPTDFAAWAQEDPGALLVSPTEIALDPVCWSGDDGRLCTQFQWVPGSLHLASRVEALELAGLQPVLPVDWQARGRISGTASARFDDGQLASARAELASGAGLLRAGAESVLHFDAAHLRVEEAREGLRFDTGLELPDGRLGSRGTAGAAGRWQQRGLDGEVYADWPDIGALTLLSPELGEAAGALKGRFALGGTVGSPSLDGELTLADGEILLRTPNTRVRELAARVAADPDQGLRIVASGRVGEGRAELAGTLQPGDGRTRLKLTGDRLLAVNTAEARVVVSPDLELSFADGLLLVTGELQVPRADITPSRFADGGIRPSSDTLILRDGQPEPQGSELRLRSDVRVRLGDEVHFDGFGLDTRLAGGLRLRDEPGRLTTASGELRLVDGRYEAYGQDLSIETGRLIFAGGSVTNPSIELRAVRRPREDIVVGVQVRGPLRQPSLNLYSTPAMSNENQLSWLVLGRAADAGTSNAEQEVLGNAALALGLKGTSMLAERLGQGLGLDEISVGAAPGEPANQAQLTIGKYLSPRLFVSYGVSLFQPGHSLRLNYEIGRGFELQTETGTDSGGDLIYTIER